MSISTKQSSRVQIPKGIALWIALGIALGISLGIVRGMLTKINWVYI